MTTPAASDGEHIFPATHLSALAVKWKECVADNRLREAAELLEEIVIACEPMFRRFAQHEGFDRTVDIESLVSIAQEKVVKWLMAWNPSTGRLFSWMTVCSKNAWRSETNKQTAYRRRFYATGDSLEQFFGTVDHAAERVSAEEQTRAKLEDIYSRWGTDQEIGALRYILTCLTDTDHVKGATIRAAGYAYGLSPEMAKFFYNWALMELRNAFYDQIRIPFTEQDLFRHANSYTHLVDLLNYITFDQLKAIIAVMGGTRLRIPTLAQMAKLSENYELWKGVEDTDKDPASIELVGKKHKRTPRTAQEVYEEMCDILSDDRCTEEALF